MPYEVPRSATERDATRALRQSRGEGRSQQAIALAYVRSRASVDGGWINFTSFVGTLTEFGTLDWSTAQAAYWCRAMVKAGVLEKRLMRTTGGRSGLAKVGQRSQYRWKSPTQGGVRPTLVVEDEYIGPALGPHAEPWQEVVDRERDLNR